MLRQSSFAAGIGSCGHLKILNGVFTPFLQLFQLLGLQFDNNAYLRLSTTPSRLVCITILIHTINNNRFTASASRQSEHRRSPPYLEPTSILFCRKNAQYSGSLSKSWSKMSTSRSSSPLIFSEHTARWLLKHKTRQIVSQKFCFLKQRGGQRKRSISKVRLLVYLSR